MPTGGVGLVFLFQTENFSVIFQACLHNKEIGCASEISEGYLCLYNIRRLRLEKSGPILMVVKPRLKKSCDRAMFTIV